MKFSYLFENYIAPVLAMIFLLAYGYVCGGYLLAAAEHGVLAFIAALLPVAFISLLVYEAIKK